MNIEYSVFAKLGATSYFNNGQFVVNGTIIKLGTTRNESPQTSCGCATFSATEGDKASSIASISSQSSTYSADIRRYNKLTTAIPT